ncbi:MAG: hypothetical protein IPN18_17530 [Ignavibacteriales bacterium]|nr:hypothetical protein [Ignavibacteriales bacterium]
MKDFEVDGTRGHLKGDILHYTHFDFGNHNFKDNKYSTLEAGREISQKPPCR